MELTMTFAGIVPLIVAAVQLAKMYINAKWAPLLAVVLGVVFAWFVTDVSWVMTILYGIVAGLTAAGLYSGGRKLIG